MHGIIRLCRRMAGIGNASAAICVRRAVPDKRLSQSCTRAVDRPDHSAALRPSVRRGTFLPGCVKHAVSRDGLDRHTPATVCLDSQTDKVRASLSGSQYNHRSATALIGSHVLHLACQGEPAFSRNVRHEIASLLICRAKGSIPGLVASRCFF
jgi:hypothetical protein